MAAQTLLSKKLKVLEVRFVRRPHSETQRLLCISTFSLWLLSCPFRARLWTRTLRHPDRLSFAFPHIARTHKTRFVAKLGSSWLSYFTFYRSIVYYNAASSSPLSSGGGACFLKISPRLANDTSAAGFFRLFNVLAFARRGLVASSPEPVVSPPFSFSQSALFSFDLGDRGVLEIVSFFSDELSSG